MIDESTPEFELGDLPSALEMNLSLLIQVNQMSISSCDISQRHSTHEGDTLEGAALQNTWEMMDMNPRVIAFDRRD